MIKPKLTQCLRATGTCRRAHIFNSEDHVESFWAKYLCTLCVRVCSVPQSPQTLCDSMGCGPPGSSIHGIFQAIMMGWVTISYSRGIFLTQGLHSCLWHLMHWQIDPLQTPPPCRPPWSGTNVGTFQEGNK